MKELIELEEKQYCQPKSALIKSPAITYTNYEAFIYIISNLAIRVEREI
jgi:hypothetical protein